MADLEKYLELLELPRGANWEQIQTAYRDLIKVWHPDRFPKDDNLRVRAEAKSKELNEAIRQLRRHYRKTALFKRSDWEKPKSFHQSASAVHRSKPFGQSFAKGGVHRTVSEENEQAPDTTWKEKCARNFSRLRKNVRRSNVRRAAGMQLIRGLGFTASCVVLGLIGAIGYPALQSSVSLAARPGALPSKELNDYRVVSLNDAENDEQTAQPAPRYTGRSVLIDSAVRCDIAKLRDLVDAVKDINTPDENGDTALAWTARLNCAAGAKVLLDGGANPNTTAKNGFTPISWARWAKNYSIEDLIRKSKRVAPSEHSR